jgi:autotransporter translocation and assembly factor TamB
LQRITPTGQVNLTNGRFASDALLSPVEEVQASISLQGGLLTIEQLNAKLGTGIIRGQGTVPLALFPLPEQLDVPSMSAPANFELAVAALSLDSFANVPPDLHGTITLSVNASADRPELEALTGTATIQQLILNARGTRVQTTAAQPTISVRGGDLTIDQFHLTGQGTSFDLSGGASLTNRELQNVEVRGNVNAGLLNTFVADLVAAGDIQLQVSASGPISDASLNGTVEMQDGRFSLRDPRVDANGLNVRLALQDRTLTIDQFQGDINGGTLTASGTVQLGEQITPNIQFALNDVDMEAPEGLHTRSSADLNLAPNGDQLLMS